MKHLDLIKKISCIALSAVILIAGGTERISAMTKDVTTDQVIKIFSPVASVASNHVINLSALYNTLTIYPNNKATGISAPGYGNITYVKSKSGGDLMVKSSANVTNDAGTACTNYIVFPFDVWDAATGKVYKAYTPIVFGTTYRANGEANTPTTFVIPASIKPASASSPYNFATYAVALNAYGLDMPMLYKPFVASGSKSLTFASAQLAAKAGRKTNTSTGQYLAYDMGTIVPKDVISKIEIVSDSITDDGYLYFGEGYGFKIYTSGAFHTSASEVTIRPKYTFVSAKTMETIPNGTEVDIYYYSRTGNENTIIKAGTASDTRQSYTVESLPAQASGYERNTTNNLIADTYTNQTAETYNLATITLNRYARILRDVRSEYRTAYEVSSTYIDNNADGMDDNLQLSQTEWLGGFYLPADAICIPKGTKQGYCNTCAKTRWSITGKCPVHNTSLNSVKDIDVASIQSFLYYGQDDFAASEGYVKVSFEVTAVNSIGITTSLNSNTVSFVDQTGNPIEVLYKIGAKVGDKYHIVYSH